MSKRLPPLNALRVFDAAARHLSFTKAAEELFVTQAAVSHQIKSLEDFLGLKLFRRRNRSLLLTEEGQSYYLDIKEIFSSINEATRKLQARSAKGALTVSLPPSFAIQWLVPRLSGFNSAYPGIDVRIQAVDREEDKLADDVDVAIFYGRGNWPGLRAERLYAEYLLPVCSPSLLTGDHPLKTAEDLAYHTLLHDVSRRDWLAYTRQLGRPSGYEPDELPGCSTPRPMDAHYTLRAFCCKPFLHFIGLNPFFCWICPQFAFFFITILRAAFFICSDSFINERLLSFSR